MCEAFSFLIKDKSQAKVAFYARFKSPNRQCGECFDIPQLHGVSQNGFNVKPLLSLKILLNACQIAIWWKGNNPSAFGIPEAMFRSIMRPNYGNSSRYCR
ncbi:hypothetical protein CEXT_115311 [Caerostris extrusa]|uniref:Uncharacterized protein n=1 Tax=Caerostris extrusa TaxID=172846 RepID=A0AAV4VXM4_CAEEX|nr:hypothetical protein CEXT_115311 [Caerostris extrusa]